MLTGDKLLFYIYRIIASRQEFLVSWSLRVKFLAYFRKEKILMILHFFVVGASTVCVRDANFMILDLSCAWSQIELFKKKKLNKTEQGIV